MDIELHPHPMVPKGEVLLVDKSMLALELHPISGRRWIAYLHPATMRQLKARLWAKLRVDAVITYAELMAELGLMRDEGAS
jgi:hypothetical protein